jgi:polysaccharide export outer membrane protein
MTGTRTLVKTLIAATFLMCSALCYQKPAQVRDVPPDYALCADDEVTLHSVQVKEVAAKSFHIDQNGEINCPLLGRVHLAGNTVRQAEEMLSTKLKAFYLEPDIALNVSALHSEPLSIIGAVGTPGVHQVVGRMTLLEMLSSAGGVRTDAGPVVKITREKMYGPIPHPSAHETATGASIADINLNSLMEARNPEENIQVKPHDVISVPLAEVVYVVGNVKRAGGFPLGGKPNLSVLQALSLAEGLDARASPKNARILQRSSSSGGEATQTPIDLKAILEGKSEDVTLHPNDILFIPSSTAKSVAARTIEAAIQIAAGVAIRY